jgi:two-component system, sensor histidine kinase and response regulator
MQSYAPHKWKYVLDEPARILVVDDDPILREFAIVHLSTPVVAVEATPDGKAALDLMLKCDVDIVLADIGMPGLDGFELLERMQAHEKLRQIPIVMLTGRESIAEIDRAYHLGATSFATKPVNWRQLSYHLRYVLRASRGQPETAPSQPRIRVALGGSGDDHDTIKDKISAPLRVIMELADRIARDCGRDPLNSHVTHATRIADAAHHALRLAREGADHDDLTVTRGRPTDHAGEVAARERSASQDATCRSFDHATPVQR